MSGIESLLRGPENISKTTIDENFSNIKKDIEAYRNPN